MQSWIHCGFVFQTQQPRARCHGKLAIIPERNAAGDMGWKIWSMATYLVDFIDYLENVDLLGQPSVQIPDDEIIQSDILVIGAGNAGLIQAARLKALQIDFVVVEKNDGAGDNWSNRYEYMRFHIGKGYCQVPFLPYTEENSYYLPRNELRDKMKQFAEAFDLDKRVLYRTRITQTTHDEASRTWTLEVTSDGRKRIIRCRGVVLATGTSFSVPYVPQLSDEGLFRGPSIHSHEFKSAAALKDAGVNSVIVVGTANSAFDVMEDCHGAGIGVMVVQRSPTLVIPMAYYEDPKGLGLFDVVPTEVADVVFMTGPLQVGGEISRQGHAARAAAQP